MFVGAAAVGYSAPEYAFSKRIPNASLSMLSNLSINIHPGQEMSIELSD
jgi:hypothetical protein